MMSISVDQVNGETLTYLEETETVWKLLRSTMLTSEQIKTFWKLVDENSEAKSLDVGALLKRAMETS